MSQAQHHTPRLNFTQIAPAIYQGLAGVNDKLKDSTVGQQLIDMVYLRVSLINGCAFCVDMHWRDLVKLDVDPRVLNSLTTWRENNFFTARECAALQWAETLTRMGETHVPDADFEALKEFFSEKEIVDLTYAIALINAWNRIAGGFRAALPK